MKQLATSQIQLRLIKTITVSSARPGPLSRSADHEQRMELGYVIHSKHLDSDNYSKDVTSIRRLGRHWCGENNNCFKTFICGNRSLGHFMNLEGFLAVPSPQNKKIKPNVVKYFSKDGGDIDGIQIEFSKKTPLKMGRKYRK